MSLLSAVTARPWLEPAFPPRSPGFLWWEWLVETTFQVPGRPLLWGGHCLWGFPGNRPCVGRQGALESCWPSPFHCRAQGFHGIPGPCCSRLTTLRSQVLRRLLTKPLDSSLSGQGTLLTTQGGAESGGGSRGFPDHPSVTSGCSIVTGVGFFPGGSATNRLYDYR